LRCRPSRHAGHGRFIQDAADHGVRPASSENQIVKAADLAAKNQRPATGSFKPPEWSGLRAIARASRRAWNSLRPTVTHSALARMPDPDLDRARRRIFITAAFSGERHEARDGERAGSVDGEFLGNSRIFRALLSLGVAFISVGIRASADLCEWSICLDTVFGPIKRHHLARRRTDRFPAHKPAGPLR